MMGAVISIILVFVFFVSITFAERIDGIHSRAVYNRPSTAGVAQASSVTVRGYGGIGFSVEDANQIVYMATTLIVPREQAHQGTIFLWPGLQPGGAHFYPIDNRVLQSVLTWGPSCAPGNKPPTYSTWWISAEYVNPNSNLTGHSSCLGGPIMAVNPGNRLRIQFKLKGTVWTQIVTNFDTNVGMMFSINMLGQAQNYVYYFIELYSGIRITNDMFFFVI